MVELKEKQIRINGKPTIIMCGEIHYYRLPISEWEDRLDKLVESGCNAVATYVPWICHEEVEGEIDLEGKTKPELNLAKFIDLCHDRGLYFFLRPGPFIMAEMKNEGIPYWVTQKHPEIVPTTWDHRVTPNPTLDYLAPSFLNEVKIWYEAVMKIAVPRLECNGGNIITMQLDNEIGMLTWVSNSPDLTDNVLIDFGTWVQVYYTKEELASRYPFSFTTLEDYKEKLVTPEESYAPSFMKDLGYYNRNRFARYVRSLRDMAESFGVRDIPFVVNIHGSSAGRGLRFPIGISQLYETYQEEGFLSGSDIYFGDLTVQNFEDLYLINGFMDAVHNEDQPLTSMEFNCGDGNFGDSLSARYDVSAVDFKARMCIAQGHRMLNYYLMAGGYNERLTHTPGDGNNRIASTGERHGYAAPLSPEGEYSYTFPRMSRSIQTIMGNKDKLATMLEEVDNIAYGFIPDYFMTESHYPKSESMKEIIRNLERHRNNSAWTIVAKLMLLMNYRYKSIDLQNKPIDYTQTKVIVLPTARYMSESIQLKLVEYMHNGGGILFVGELPTFDMEGKPCTVLVDALNVKVKETIHNKPRFFLSVYPEGFATGAETRSDFAQTYSLGEGVESIYRVYFNNEVCGFESKVGEGKAIVFGCDLKANFPLIKESLTRLGGEKAISHDHNYHGLFITSMKNKDDERYLHILNLDGFDKDVHLSYNNEPLFEGKKLTIMGKDGLMLPLNMTFNDVKLHYSTAEIFNVKDHEITFRITQSEDVIVLETSKEVLPSEDYSVTKKGNRLYITSKKHAKLEMYLTVKFN